MAKQIQLRGGSTTDHSTFIGAAREVTVDTDKNTLVVHDGVTAGGIPLAKQEDVANSAGNGTSERQVYTATAGQTSFNATYDIGFVDVYVNGLKLQKTEDFTATNGTTVVLTSGANAGDVVDIVAYGTFEIADTYTQAQADALLDTKADTTYVDTEIANIDLSTKADKSNVLELNNTTAFTPDADYEPATKKYVDDEIIANVPTELGLGYNQTWQDVTASRSDGVTYTNTTGKPIAVSVRGAAPTSYDYITLFVDGLEVNEFGQGVSSASIVGNVVGIIPNGSIYRIDIVSSANLVYWNELR